LLDIKKPTSDHRVLLADDDKDILNSVTRGLKSQGFKVDTFRNPLHALSYFRPHYYDTIILDVRMPEMSGFELAQKIWQEDHDARICFFSALEVYENEARRIFAGKEYCFIKKPIGLNDLIAHIRGHVYSVVEMAP
jgi:DNA-binding response OmpR family regulator